MSFPGCCHAALAWTHQLPPSCNRTGTSLKTSKRGIWSTSLPRWKSLTDTVDARSADVRYHNRAEHIVSGMLNKSYNCCKVMDHRNQVSYDRAHLILPSPASSLAPLWESRASAAWTLVSTTLSRGADSACDGDRTSNRRTVHWAGCWATVQSIDQSIGWRIGIYLWHRLGPCSISSTYHGLSSQSTLSRCKSTWSHIICQNHRHTLPAENAPLQ